MRRDWAITPLAPEVVERIRATLLDQGRVQDATLVSVLAYAGVRPQEAVALRWRNVRKNTLLIEQAVADGELKGQKTNRPPRSVTLLAPLREDPAAWRIEQQIRLARVAGRDAAEKPPSRQLSLGDVGDRRERGGHADAAQIWPRSRVATDDDRSGLALKSREPRNCGASREEPSSGLEPETLPYHGNLVGVRPTAPDHGGP